MVWSKGAVACGLAALIGVPIAHAQDCEAGQVVVDEACVTPPAAVTDLRVTRRPHGVLVAWTASDAVAYSVRWAVAGEALDCTSGASVDAAEATTAFLTDVPGDARASLIVCAIDALGLTTASPAAAIPVVDRDPPVVRSVRLEGGGTHTPRADVRLELDVIDVSAIAGLCIQEGTPAACPKDGWRDWSDRPVFTLGVPEGPASLRVWVEDDFGNRSVPHDVGLVLDGRPPTVGTLTAQLVDGQLVLHVTGLSDNASTPWLVARQANGQGCAGASGKVVGQGTDRDLALSGGALVGVERLLVCAVDEAGNTALAGELAVPEALSAPVVELVAEPVAPPVAAPVAPAAPTFGKEGARVELAEGRAVVPSSRVSVTVDGGTDGPPYFVRLEHGKAPTCRRGGKWIAYEPGGIKEYDTWVSRGTASVYVCARWISDDVMVGPLRADVVVDDRAPSGGSVWTERHDNELQVLWDGFVDAESSIAAYVLVGAKGAPVHRCELSPKLYRGLETSFSIALDPLEDKQKWAFAVCAIDVVGHVSPPKKRATMVRMR